MHLSANTVFRSADILILRPSSRTTKIDAMNDPFDLQRFVTAQDDTFEQALAECRRGRKRTHWMWFIFPQVRGLGSSTMAQDYAIRSLDEARAYLAHSVLGPRLVQCLEALQDLTGILEPENIFGPIDSVKLRSSLTLFIAADGPHIFQAALQRWFGGRDDTTTLAILKAREGD
jgi:uncharacterized protein (DUF1810 family)